MALTNSNKVSSYIPDSIAISILSKLPFKSLKRFTCAQKSWSLLFQNPNFIKMFLSAHSSQYDDANLLIKQTVHSPSHNGFHCLLYLLSGEKFENKVKLEWPSPFNEEDTHEWPPDIFGCVNGIVCVFDFKNESGIFWNPTTNECINIHSSPSQFLALDCTIFTLHGFGYDHVRDDYKVIRCVLFNYYIPNFEDEFDLAYVPTDTDPLWEIYSIRSDSWRKLDMDMPLNLTCSGVYLNGMCHWLGGSYYNIFEIDCVVSFNLSSETFITTPLLFDMHDVDVDADDSELREEPKRELMVLNGYIAMISRYSMSTSFHISILGEPGFERSWVKLFIIGPLPFIKEPIGAGLNSNIFFRTEDDDLVCFDLNTQRFEELGFKGVLGCQTVSFKKNLFPIIKV